MASVEDCLFCGIVAGTVPGEIVDSDEHTVAFMDINPATPGHALIVPRDHSVDLTDVPDADLERTILAARRLARRMDEVLRPDGFNILNSCRAAAWQSVFHFHIHVIPRYADDPLELPWVPGPGEAAEIAEVAGRLRGDG
jgi:histidine triad (HIT) family protein